MRPTRRLAGLPALVLLLGFLVGTGGPVVDAAVYHFRTTESVAPGGYLDAGGATRTHSQLCALGRALVERQVLVGAAGLVQLVPVIAGSSAWAGAEQPRLPRRATPLHSRAPPTRMA